MEKPSNADMLTLPDKCYSTTSRRWSMGVWADGVLGNGVLG